MPSAARPLASEGLAGLQLCNPKLVGKAYTIIAGMHDRLRISSSLNVTMHQLEGYHLADARDVDACACRKDWSR